MASTKIYAIIGTKGQGKDTFADFLVTQLYENDTLVVRFAFADFVKQAAAAVTQINEAYFFENSLKDQSLKDTHFLKMTPRDLVKKTADFFKAELGETCFVDAAARFMADQIHHAGEYFKQVIFVITDVRFSYEFNYLQAMNAEMIFVHRDFEELGFFKKLVTHESEHGLYGRFDKYSPHHFMVWNMTTKEHLKHEAQRIVQATEPHSHAYTTVGGLH